MKKQLKAIFKISVSFVAFGMVIMLAGLLLGGAKELGTETVEAFYVFKGGVAEVIESIPALERVFNINGFTLVVDKDNVTFEVNEEYETMSGDCFNCEIAEASQVENLYVIVFNGKCRLLPSDNGYFGVESRDAANFQCYEADGTLYLCIFPKSNLFSGKNSEVTLFVPEGVEYDKIYMLCSGEQMEVACALKGKDFDLDSVCGENSFAGNLSFENTSISAGIGKLEMNGLSSKSMNLEVNTAEVTIRGMEVVTMAANLSMGSITINGTTKSDAVLVCGMGSLDMTLAGGQTEYNYDISGSAESLQIGTDTLAGMVLERWIDNGADKKIVVTCSMGSVKIGFQQ